MFSERLKKLRTEANLTQVELASALTVDKSSVAKYESGKAMPSIDVLIKLAKFFSVTTDYLLGLDDNKKAPAHNRADANPVWQEIEKLLNAATPDKIQDAMRILRALLSPGVQ